MVFMKNTKIKLKNLWGAAFEELPEEKVFSFTSGKDVYKTAPFDLYLAPYDIWASKVHCLGLLKQKIIDKDSAKAILYGLDEIEGLVEKGEFELDPKKEDIHTNIESYLIERIGIEKAGKLHTARSRNDQIAVATRLFIRDKTLETVEEISSLVHALLKKASELRGSVLPGFTHHQHAMPTSFAHLLLFYAGSFLRDAKRFSRWWDLFNYNPLGSAAGFGTSFPIDQEYTSNLLGFKGPVLNSLDSITNRWEAEAEYLFSLSIFFKHLSSLAQTLIIFSTPEFGFVKLPDKYTTGSSIMPQKKNPDVLEAIKGKAAYISSKLFGLLEIGQAAFFGYNRETQWSKYLLIEAYLEAKNAGKIMAEVINALEVDKKRTREFANKSFITATNLLEAVCQKQKIPFRVAKILLEKSIKYSRGKDKVDFKAFGKAAKELSLNVEMSQKEFDALQTPEKCLSRNVSLGGPGGQSVKTALKESEKELKQILYWLEEKLKLQKNSKGRLKKLIKSL